MNPVNRTVENRNAGIKPANADAKLDLAELASRLERAELELLALRVSTLTLLETSVDGIIVADAVAVFWQSTRMRPRCSGTR